MTSVSYPGIYVEEIAGGAKPIESAGTSTAAFVGLAEKGPDGEAVLVTSWDAYQRQFGGFIDTSKLAESVFAFFNNGGRQCYVVRVVAADAQASTVTVVNRDGSGAAGVVFKARHKGSWGDSIVLSIGDGSKDPGNEFKLTLRQQPDPAVLPIPAELAKITPLEEHDNLSMDPLAPNAFGKVLARDSAILDATLSVGNNVPNKGMHRSGEPSAPPAAGSPHLPPPITSSSNAFLISLDGDSYQTVVLPTSASQQTWRQLCTTITGAVSVLTPRKSSVDADAYLQFACTTAPPDADTAIVTDPKTVVRLVLTSGKAHAASAVQVQNAPQNNVAALLHIGAGNGGVSFGALAHTRPEKADGATAIQLGDAQKAGLVVDNHRGSDGTLPSDWSGHETLYSAAFTRLDGKTDVNLLAVPGIGTSAMMDLGVAYCENRPLQDMFYIGEVASDTDEVTAAMAFRRNLTNPSSYGALYYPWVTAVDPSGRSATKVALPPSGYIAGLYSRIDGARGVWKAPAGTEASIRGVVGLVSELTDTEQGNLNPMGVNVIRRFAVSGIVCWGARTVSADPEYRYVSVRRTAIMLRRSIYDGIQWAVFEPNEERLWSALRLNISSFMNGLYRSGAFQGSKASDAYFVRCGLGDTMTQGDIDRGQVIVLVGFAPVKPAEFVIVRIQQKLGPS